MSNTNSIPKIIAIEESEIERQEISKMLGGCEVLYERSIIKAMNKIGIEKIDCVLVDADCSSKLFNWKEFTSFLKKLNLKFIVFSSNGKVGMIGEQKIIHLNQISEMLNNELLQIA
jgi:hypothetical protein